MAKKVTLSISDDVFKRAENLAALVSESVEEVLATALETALPDVDARLPIGDLSDTEVLALTTARMESAEDERLSELLEKRKARGLDEDERIELSRLHQSYLLLWLRQSEAIAEATRRGLRGPVSA